jgi:hypothetical protein
VEDRSQYLALAQLSQSVVRSILSYLEENELEPLKVKLSGIVGPLEDCLGERAAPPATAFTTYEGLNTLSDAWGTQTEDILGLVRKFLEFGGGTEAKGAAEELLVPFQKLSAQALLNFEQPEHGFPLGVFKLCGVQ